MAAVCHAFVLRDFTCGILAEVGIGEIGEEVGDEIAVNRFIRVDIFRAHYVPLILLRIFQIVINIQ